MFYGSNPLILRLLDLSCYIFGNADLTLPLLTYILCWGINVSTSTLTLSKGKTPLTSVTMLMPLNYGELIDILILDSIAWVVAIFSLTCALHVLCFGLECYLHCLRGNKTLLQYKYIYLSYLKEVFFTSQIFIFLRHAGKVFFFF